MAVIGSTTLLVMGVVLIGFIAYGDAVRCYVCTEVVHGKARCGPGSTLTPSDTGYIRNCSSCSKTTVEINLIFSKAYTHSRACATGNETAGCSSNGIGLVNGEKCICNTDFCNGAKSVGVGVLAVLASVLGALMSLRS